MTISQFELYHTPTENIAKANKFFPTRIRVPHPQLRHLISTVEKDRIYYVDGYDIFFLDLLTYQSILLATIPFEARCLTANHGWVCVGGGDHGDCAFIRIEQEDGVPRTFGHDLNVDVLGGDIVNSMNIHMMRNEDDEESEPVVLISNNDKTVKIYSLIQRKELAKLQHPEAMNYATMSPDCNTIAAVGDCHNVYFYKRRRIDENIGVRRKLSPYPEYDWRPFAVPTVPVGETINNDYSFAVAFSPSGHLCAASAQGGAITVFDMQKLQDSSELPEAAILCNFRSSRPNLCGCVRAMSFSPEPWDLLAWAEDHGRIGIADMRTFFIRRQILDLNKQLVENVEIEDGTPETYKGLDVKEKLKQQHLERLRSMQGLASRSFRSLDGLDGLSNGVTRDGYSRSSLPTYQDLQLDARERSVLDALETTMDDIGHVTTTGPRHPSESDTSSSTERSIRRVDTSMRREYDVQLLNPESRSSGRSLQPRRRTSVILSESSFGRPLNIGEGSRTRLSASPGRITDNDGTPPMSANDLTPAAGNSSSQPSIGDIPPTDPWHVIQSALENARRAERVSTTTVDDRPATLAQIEAALRAERELGEQLERQLAEERQLSTALRRHLDAQEQLLRFQQRSPPSDQGLVPRLEPSLERLLHRELENEQQYGEQRSHELETEIRLGSNRARRLESERARLIDDNSPITSHATRSATSAYVSSLPTTNTRQGERTETLEAALRRHEAFRQERIAYFQSLERQARRAESRVISASSDLQALENAIQRGNRISRGQARTRLVVSAATDATSNQTETLEQRAHRARGARRVEEGPARRSELAVPIATHEMVLARMMLMSGMTTNRGLDSNGNWIAGASLQRLIGRNTDTPNLTSVQEMVRELGPGTAGLGWSSNGQYLYAGSEEGIFEFKINLRDRMTFPSFEMR